MFEERVCTVCGKQNNWLRNHYSNRESNINNIFSAFSEYLEETYD